jgi:DNA-3-methyladenine glycosylase
VRLSRRDLGDVSTTVAPRLLGARIVHETADGRVAVRLTEVEAYTGQGDPGSHAYRGSTPRTAVMFGPAGHLYVYFTYGMHWCANVVCGPDGEASAVLLRAGEVVDGRDLARRRRPPARRDVDLARGPARLATTLGLGAAQDGADLCAPDARCWLEPAPSVVGQDVLRTGPRVGVSGSGGDALAFPWRFWLHGEPTVSAYRPANPRGRPAPRSDTLAPG